MAVLYLTERGTTLGAESETLVLRRRGRVLHRMPAIAVERVAVLAPAHLTTEALRLCTMRLIEVVIVTRFPQAFIRLGASEAGLRLRAAQLHRSEDSNFALEFARAIVIAKLRGSRRLLARSAQARSTDLKRAVRLLDKLAPRVDHAGDIGRLRGIEGRASAIYFDGLRAKLNPEYGFQRRTRRPPRDPANALLSFAYTLLTTEAAAAVASAGLEPALGFFHVPRHGRPALALDLVEEFRATIADALCLRLMGLRIIRPSDFRDRRGKVLLKPEPRRTFIRAYETKMLASLPGVPRWRTLRDALHGQASVLATTIQTGAPYVGYTTTK